MSNKVSQELLINFFDLLIELEKEVYIILRFIG